MILLDSETREAILDGASTLKNKIQMKIGSNLPPPNAPSTVKRKGSSRTLFDTGTMLNSVDIRVIDESEDTLDVAIGIFDGEVAEYASANEYGAKINIVKIDPEGMHQEYKTIIIPERSFMRSTYDESIDEILNDIGKAVGNIASNHFKKY